ncbi:MAG: RluA family pseudouridine synthase [Planctomycetes bacterium]|nr:RluA family pseudouridine synthase [Planctomycetota bacterium]MCW8136016.1 RluA family pseudouridine synthase [Planctomycetota bacterium]
MTRTFTITADEAGQRLDRFLRKLLDDVSLSAIYKLVRTRQVTVNQRKAQPEARLAVGDVITFHQAAQDRHLKPKLRDRTFSKRRDFKVLFEDEHIIAVNKPPGLLVHAGDRGDDRDTLIDQVTGYLLEQPQQAPEGLRDFVKPSPTFAPTLAHRIDRETSGVVLVGKTLAAAQALAAMLKKREISKTYLALALGGLPAREGTIDVPIERKQDGKGRRRKVEAGAGRRAVTHYRVLAQRGHFTLLELDLETGRTHQIRAHLAHIGAPLVGDDEYGDRKRNRHAAETLGIRRQFLHAARVHFMHPLTGQDTAIAAPLWPDLLNALDRAGFGRNDLPSWLHD